jgi:hypothetical protein
VDVETTSAIERLTERIGKHETSVHDDMTGLRSEIGNLRTEMREGLEEVRRHARMLNEQTNDRLRVVAEGVADLSVKIDSLSR